MNRHLDVPTLSLNYPVTKPSLQVGSVENPSLNTKDTLIGSTANNNVAMNPFRVINPDKSQQSLILQEALSLSSNTAELSHPFFSIPAFNSLLKTTVERSFVADGWPLQSESYFPINLQKSLGLISRFSPIDRQAVESGRETSYMKPTDLNDAPANARSVASFCQQDWQITTQKKTFEFVTPKIVHTAALYNLLLKVFLNGTTIEAHELELSCVEQLLLMEFLRRKFKNLSINFEKKAKLDPADFTELILRARSQKSTKRIEERKKFVYKHTLKKLKKEFYDSEFFRRTSQSKDLFYEYYFGEIAQRREIRLENFYDPLNLQSKERVYRTLSNLYLSLLFESPMFKHDFLLYMQSSDFIRDYQRSVDKKIEKLLLKWEELFQKNTPEEAIIKNVKEYFTLNRQCKLPWTAEEVMHAAKSFVKFTDVN